MSKSIQELKTLATQIRRDILRMVNAVNSGHPGGSLGCVEYFVALYGKILDYKLPFQMEGKNEDLFFLSNGHISPVLYATLARNNFFPVEELSTFRKLNTRLQGHPTTHDHLPGIRMASGSLGQGLSVAIGAALGKKLDGDKNLVFTLHGDGELQEGQIWEALMYASHNKVDNVLSLDNLQDKLKAFGWEVLEENNGNDLEAVINILEKAKSLTGKGKPVAIILHTEMGAGVDFMMGTYAWHGKAPNNEQLEKALAQLTLDNLNDY